MEIVFSNPCFIGDVLCTIPPIHVWKKLTNAKITLFYEQMTVDSEPLSILKEDPAIDEIHCLPFGSIPRTSRDGKIVKVVTKEWFEEHLGRKVDQCFDLHQHWTGSNGKNWFKYSELDWDKQKIPLQFFPTKDQEEMGLEFKGMVGISDRVPGYETIAKTLQDNGLKTIYISKNLGMNLMEVHCIIKNLDFLVTACCLHNTLCWATATPNYVMWTAQSKEIWFDYQNPNTTIIHSNTQEELYAQLRAHKRITS